jgi:uncharacterized protein YciI
MLQYTFVEGIMEKRKPYRQAHLDLLEDLSSKKKCHIAGAFANPGTYVRKHRWDLDVLEQSCIIS